MHYNQRDIVLVPFPYSDLTAIKKRPVLIISNNDFNQKSEDVLVCVITSKNYKDAYSIDLSNDSLEFGILPESSVIKTFKLFTISKNKIIKKFSIINPSTFSLVKEKVIELIK